MRYGNRGNVEILNGPLKLFLIAILSTRICAKFSSFCMPPFKFNTSIRNRENTTPANNIAILFQRERFSLYLTGTFPKLVRCFLFSPSFLILFTLCCSYTMLLVWF